MCRPYWRQPRGGMRTCARALSGDIIITTIITDRAFSIAIVVIINSINSRIVLLRLHSQSQNHIRVSCETLSGLIGECTKGLTDSIRFSIINVVRVRNNLHNNKTTHDSPINFRHCTLASDPVVYPYNAPVACRGWNRYRHETQHSQAATNFRYIIIDVISCARLN